MKFLDYPPLFTIQFPALKPGLPEFNEMGLEDKRTAVTVERYNKERLALLETWHTEETFPDVEVREFKYRNGDYTGAGIVYRPKTTDTLPIALFVHGGSYTTLSKECYHYECAAMAAQGDAVVFNVDYRLAYDGVKIPTSIEDCYAAFLSVAEQAKNYGGDPSRLAVIGDSAGGHMVASVAILARERGGPKISRQILCYPGIGFDMEDAGRRSYFLENCFDRPEDSQAAHINLLADQEKEKTIPTTIIIGSCDFLLEEDVRYAQGLVTAGVAVDFQLFQGMPHGFIQLPTEEGRASIAYIAKTLQTL